MKALITGAGSGIGRDMAKYLAAMKYDLILVGRDKQRLEELQNELQVNSKIIIADLSDPTRVKEVYVMTKNEDIDILINDAGFGAFGKFYETDLNNEIDMINTNVVAVHLLYAKEKLWLYIKCSFTSCFWTRSADGNILCN